MGAHLERAWVLFEQRRNDLAAQEARTELENAPDSPEAQGLLAMCLAAQGEHDAALRAAQESVQLAPEWNFPHYALGQVYRARKQYALAHAALEESMRMAPELVDNHAALASLHLDEGNWRQAVESARQGLQLDPVDLVCLEVTAMALFELGRDREAEETIQTILKSYPNSASAHATWGWILTNQGRIKQAGKHFREAARIDPDWEWPRAGIVDVIKARSPAYRAYLWSSSLSIAAQSGIRLLFTALATLIIFGVLATLGHALQRRDYLIVPAAVFFVSGTLHTVAIPLSNLLYFSNPGVRFALTREQTLAAWALPVVFTVAALTIGVCAFAPLEIAFLAVAVLFGLAGPVCRIFDMTRGASRWLMVLYTLGMAFAGLVGLILFRFETFPGIELCVAYCIAWFCSDFAAALAAGQRAHAAEGDLSEKETALVDADGAAPDYFRDEAPATPRQRRRGARRVLARRGGWLYPGTIQQSDGAEHYIAFDDRGEGWCDASDCHPLKIRIGSTVYCRWKGGEFYYRGTVREVRGNEVYIYYDDGDREWNVIDLVRIPLNARADFWGRLSSNTASYGCLVFLLLAVAFGVIYIVRIIF